MEKLADDPRAFSDFRSSAEAVLRLLHERLGFNLWMITRTEGEDWIVLQANDHGYGVTEGTVFRWTDSFCSRMVAGKGPRFAPRSAEVPAYVEAPIGQQVPIGAYIGIPLTRGDGSLFGTLCAINPSPVPDAIGREQPLVELLAGLLSRMLETELGSADLARRAERAEAEALTDGLTGLYNRRGWDHLVAAEENRCRRHGHAACVFAIDVDGLKSVNDRHGHEAGDELIRRLSGALRAAAREQDIVARVGGDEFALLAVECDHAASEALVRRLRESLALAQVNASLGSCQRHPSEGIVAAWKKADQAMYEEKRARK